MRFIGIVVSFVLLLICSGKVWAEEGSTVPDKKVPKEVIENPGKDVFLKFRCNQCHSVSILGIGKDADEEEDEDDWDDEEEDEVEPPDLSGVAAKKHKIEFLIQYLKKKVSQNGRKHKKKFKGSEEETKALVAWLQMLNWPDQSKPKEEPEK